MAINNQPQYSEDWAGISKTLKAGKYSKLLCEEELNKDTQLLLSFVFCFIVSLKIRKMFKSVSKMSGHS